MQPHTAAVLCKSSPFYIVGGNNYVPSYIKALGDYTWYEFYAPSYITALGDYTGAELWVYDQEEDIKDKWVEFHDKTPFMRFECILIIMVSSHRHVDGKGHAIL